MALSAEPGLKVSKEEDVDSYDGDTARSTSNPAIKLLAVLVGISVILGGAWIGFGPRIMAMIGGEGADVPTIAADAAPVKVRPESPGGMQVPNQGRLVYGVVDGTASQPRIERLLPSAEKPVAVEDVLTRPVPETNTVVTGSAPRGSADIAASAVTDEAPRRLEPPQRQVAATPSEADVSNLAGPPPVASAPSPAPVEVAQAPAPTAPAAPRQIVTETASAPPVPSSEPPVATTQPQAAPAAPAPAAPTQTARAAPAPAAPTTDLGQTFRVQLAASRSEPAVKSEWDRLRRRHIDLLGDLQLQVTRIDLGATKGVFYRLRVGPLENETTAKALCERLKQRKLGCLVVKPGA